MPVDGGDARPASAQVNLRPPGEPATDQEVDAPRLQTLGVDASRVGVSIPWIRTRFGRNPGPKPGRPESSDRRRGVVAHPLFPRPLIPAIGVSGFPPFIV